MTIPLVNLATVAKLNPSTPTLAPDDEVAFVPMAAVSERGSMRTAEYKSAADLANGYSYFQSGDVLLAKITPCYENNKIAVANITRLHGFGSTEFHVIRPDLQKLDARYLAYYLRQDTVRKSGTRRMTGSGGQRRVPRNFIEELKIPLPPIGEQRRIAAILDQADALRHKRRDALTQASNLASSIFFSIFRDPVLNPLKFERSTFDQFCRSKDDIRCGPFGTQLLREEFLESGIPLWGIKHVNSAFEIQTDEFVSSKKAEDLDVYSIVAGDIVMTRKGTVGNCAVYPSHFPNGIMHSDLLRVRVDQEKCNPVFVAHQLRLSPDVTRQIALISGGAIMPGINVGKLKSISLLLPPKPLQDEFAQRVTQVEAVVADQSTHLAQLNDLFASLQHRAFRGEL